MTTTRTSSGTPTAYTTQQLDSMRKAVENGGVDAAVSVYTELQNNGYTYAGWARGVATNQTATGQAANGFLNNSSAQNLSAEQMNQIKTDMAVNYLNTLIANSERTGVITKDVNYKDT